MRRKILGIALIFLASLCLCLSLNQADKYLQAEKTYDDILEKYTKEKKVSKKKQDFVVDWKKLWKTNKDVVGWIKMDSGADYPILHGDSNEEYLHTDLYGDYNINGSIFVNADNSRDWSDPNTIIYGHRMNNGSMFGSNKKYMEKDYLKKHPDFSIYRPDGCYVYKIFNVMVVEDGTYPYTYQFPDKKSYIEYLSKVKQYSYYDSGITVPDARQIVTLSTCTYINHVKKRLVIQGYIRQIREYKGMVQKRKINILEDNAFSKTEMEDTNDKEID